MRKTVITICIFSLSFISAASSYAADRASALVQQGNSLFHKKKYTQSASKYSDAQKLRPEAPEIDFNLANSYYKQEDFPGAIDLYKKVAESPKSSDRLRQEAVYNLGNCAFMQGMKLLDSDLKKSLEEFRDSILHYRDAIKMDETDEDAKYNIEVARLKIKDILDKLKKEAEKQKEQQKKAEEFAKKLREAIEKQKEIISDTEKQKEKQPVENTQSETKDIISKQTENKDRTTELIRELQDQIDQAQQQSKTPQGTPLATSQQEAKNLLANSRIDQGSAIENLNKNRLQDAKKNEDDALNNLEEALKKLTEQQQQQPQQQQAQQKGQQQQPRQQGKEQEKEKAEKGEKQQKEKRLSSREAMEKLEELKARMAHARRESEKELRNKGIQPIEKFAHEPVDKDW